MSQVICSQSVSHIGDFFGYDTYYIPGTQMTLVLVGKGLVLGG